MRARGNRNKYLRRIFRVNSNGKKAEKHRSSCSGLKPWCHNCHFIFFSFSFHIPLKFMSNPLDSTFKLYLGSDTTSLFFYCHPSRSHHHLLVWITAVLSLSGYSEVYFQHSNQYNLLRRMLCNFI